MLKPVLPNVSCDPCIFVGIVLDWKSLHILKASGIFAFAIANHQRVQLFTFVHSAC